MPILKVAAEVYERRGRLRCRARLFLLFPDSYRRCGSLEGEILFLLIFLGRAVSLPIQ